MEASMTLSKRVNARLSAGATVVVVQDADEELALAEVLEAVKAFKPVEVFSATGLKVSPLKPGDDPAELHDVNAKIQGHKFAKESKDLGGGTLVILAGIELYGENPAWQRMVREHSLQTRQPGEKYTRLVFIEQLHVKIPQGFVGDSELVSSKLPTVEELKTELEAFIQSQGIKLAGNGEEKHSLASACSGLPRHEASRLLARSWVERGKKLDPAWLRAEKAHRIVEKLGGSISFDMKEYTEIGGYDLLKSDIALWKASFGSQKAFEYGIDSPKGILVVGPPGCGKTELARYIAFKLMGEPPYLDPKLMTCDIGKVFGGLVGQSEGNMRLLTQTLSAVAPGVVLFDEYEKMMGSGGLDGGTSQRVTGTLLSWQENHTEPVFCVATVNSTEELKPELMRPGRFDAVYFMDYPDVYERRDIFKIQLAKKKRALPDEQVHGLAEATDGFSGAEIRQIVIEGLYRSYADGARELAYKDLLAARKVITPLSVSNKKKLEAAREWAQSNARPASSKKGVQEEASLGTVLKRGPMLEQEGSN